MGLVGDLSDPAPVLPTVVTSADGAVEVTADSVWGGAELVVDFATYARRNLYDNPSFEAGVGRWVALGGADAPVVSTAQAWVGGQSLHCVRGAGTSYVYASDGGVAALLTEGAGEYTAVVRDWMPASNTATGGIRWGGTGIGANANVTTEIRDDWVDLIHTFTWDGAGSIILYAFGNHTTSEIYIDGIHIVPGTTPPTEYVDGDQPDTATHSYAWDGTPHASSSTLTVYPTTPHSIRIHRRTPDGQVVAVRGADPNLSPGGISPGYDHEAPLGVVCTWWAEALDRDGNILWTSDEVTLTLPWPDDCTAWLKSIANPGLSARVAIDQWEESGRDARTSTYDIHGTSARAATLRTPARRTATIGIQTFNRADYDTVAALLDGGVLLLDSTDAHGIGEPVYLIRVGELPIERPGDLTDWRYRRHVATVEIVDRPPTPGSPMRTPAVSWETLPYSTYTEMGAANPTWLATPST